MRPAPRLAPTLVTSDPGSEPGQKALLAYMDEVVSRYWGRQATPAEMQRAMAEDPSEDLAPPAGLLVVAVNDAEPIGCGGVRLLGDGIAELTRVYVARPMRRRGLGARIVRYLEAHAAGEGRHLMRLATRGALIEARALYARLGYREVPPFSTEPYAEHWLEKPL